MAALPACMRAIVIFMIEQKEQTNQCDCRAASTWLLGLRECSAQDPLERVPKQPQFCCWILQALKLALDQLRHISRGFFLHTYGEKLMLWHTYPVAKRAEAILGRE